MNSIEEKCATSFATIAFDHLGRQVQYQLKKQSCSMEHLHFDAGDVFNAPSSLGCLFLLFDSSNTDAAAHAKNVAQQAKQLQIPCIAVAAFPEAASTNCNQFDGIMPIYLKINEMDLLVLNMTNSIVNLIAICCADDCLISLDFTDVISCLKHGSFIQSISFCESGLNANEQIIEAFCDANAREQVWGNYNGCLILFSAPDAQLKKSKVREALNTVASRCADMALIKHGVQYANTDAHTIRVLIFCS